MHKKNTVKEHFINPKNAGELSYPGITGSARNRTSGDMVNISLLIDSDIVKEARFKAFGCGALIASASMMTELLKGKKREDAERLSGRSVIEAFAEFPDNKKNCASLVEEALKDAFVKYRREMIYV